MRDDFFLATEKEFDSVMQKIEYSIKRPTKNVVLYYDRHKLIGKISFGKYRKIYLHRNLYQLELFDGEKIMSAEKMIDLSLTLNEARVLRNALSYYTTKPEGLPMGSSEHVLELQRVLGIYLRHDDLKGCTL